MNSSSGLSLSITPVDNIVMLLEKGDGSISNVSIWNHNDQKIIVKLRSDAGKYIRIKNNSFALDSNQKMTIDIRLPAKTVDELIQQYNDTKVLKSFRLQFNIVVISDLTYEKLLSLSEDQRELEITTAWGRVSKADIQQIVKTVSLSYKSFASTSIEERKSEESINSLVSTDVNLTPEYKKLRKQYEALCIVFKRCQEMIKTLQQNKIATESKLQKSECNVSHLKSEMDTHTCQSNTTTTSVKPSMMTGITVFLVILAFVMGFVVGQFATQYVWK